MGSFLSIGFVSAAAHFPLLHWFLCYSRFFVPTRLLLAAARKNALTRKPVPILWDEASAKPTVETPVDEESSAWTAH